MERKGANCLWMMGLEEIHPTDLADRKTIVEKMSSKGKGKCYGLEFGYFSEIEITNLHGGHHHVKRLFSAGTPRNAHGFDIRKHLDETLVETKIADSLLNFSILHQEGSVASHAGDNLLVGIDFADVPQSCNQHAAFGGSDHLFQSLRIFRSCKNNVDRHLAHFVRQRESVAGGFDRTDFVAVFRTLHAFGGGACIDNAPDDPVLHQWDAHTTHTFTVKR